MLYLIVFGIFFWVLVVVIIVDFFSTKDGVSMASIMTRAVQAGDDGAEIDDGPKRSFAVNTDIDMKWFQGKWDRKFWMNIPGPFYSTVDNVLTSPVSDDVPSFIMDGGTDGEECHFVWRQPEYEYDAKRCLQAMSNDDTASYQIDGNQRWTPELVRDWWRREKERLIEWAEQELEKLLAQRGTKFYSVTREGNLHVYIRFMNQDAEGYLRKYIYFLETGDVPQEGDALPEL